MRKIINIAYFGFLIITPIILLLLPADFFDHSKVQLCMSKILFDRECFACGTTRAVMHAIHLEFKSAWEFNKLVVFVIPFILYLYVTEMIRMYKLIYPKSKSI